MKITYLTGEYPPMQGGIADHTAYLAHHLIKLDNTFPSVLTTRRWQETEVEQPIHFAAADTRHPIVYPLLSGWGRLCWPEIRRFLETYRPDVLHIQYQAAAFDLGGWVNWLPRYLTYRRLPTRIVTTFHDLRIPYIFPKAGPFRWYSMMTLARHSHGIICTNREDLQTLAEELGVKPYQFTNNIRVEYKPSPQPSPTGRGSKASPPVGGIEGGLSVPEHPQGERLGVRGSRHSHLDSPDKAPLLTLIPLGSNVETQPPADFDRGAWRQRYRVSAEGVVLAYFGFLNESKGGEELIQALALLRQQGLDAHLVFVGGDIGHADPTNLAYARRIQQLIDGHNLTGVVHRTGYVELAEVSANLLAADAVVMPYRDGVSFRRTTLIAALRHGCPVISTIPADRLLIPEVKSGKNMLLVPPRQPQELAQAVAQLAADPALQQTLAAGAISLGDLFEWDTIVRQTRQLYELLS